MFWAINVDVIDDRQPHLEQQSVADRVQCFDVYAATEVRPFVESMHTLGIRLRSSRTERGVHRH